MVTKSQLDSRTRNIKYTLDQVISSSPIGPDELVGASQPWAPINFIKRNQLDTRIRNFK